MIKEIRQALGLYKPNCEYIVYLRDIKVPEEYRKKRIGRQKFENKLSYYKRTGEFESLIKIDKDFNLIDGYSSIVLSEMYDVGKVNVIFVDKECDKNR